MQVDNLDALSTVTARFFKGLGDPVRLRILNFLSEGEKSVGEIVEQLGLAQNHVSMQLGCLRWCGYVSRKQEGRYVFYSLGDAKVMEIVHLAEDVLRGSEVYFATCEVIGESSENLANITGWRNR